MCYVLCVVCFVLCVIYYMSIIQRLSGQWLGKGMLGWWDLRVWGLGFWFGWGEMGWDGGWRVERLEGRRVEG